MEYPLKNDLIEIIESGLKKRGFLKDDVTFKWNGYGVTGSKPYTTFITDYSPKGFDPLVKGQFIVQITHPELLLRVGIDDDRSPFFLALVRTLEEVDEIKRIISEPE